MDQDVGTICLNQGNNIQLTGGSQFDFVSGGTNGLNLTGDGLLTGQPITGTAAGPASFQVNIDGNGPFTISYTLANCGANMDCQSAVVTMTVDNVTTQLSPSINDQGFQVECGRSTTIIPQASNVQPGAVWSYTQTGTGQVVNFNTATGIAQVLVNEGETLFINVEVCNP